MRQRLRLARLAAGGVADRLDEAVVLAARRFPTGWSASPAGRPPSAAVDGDPAGSLARAAAFLRDQQRPDGSLRGFVLLPGSSTSWITAHAAFVLEAVPELDDVCARAADHLAASLGQREGWGYNERVGEDLDTTAQALLVLHRAGAVVPERAVELVTRNQHPDGGFPTYPPRRPGAHPDNGWQVPHPDVTAVVAELLRRLGGHDEARTRAVAWLGDRCVGGMLPSYWWADEAYGLWVQHRAGLATSASRARAGALVAVPLHHPWAAMALDAAVHDDGSTTSAEVTALLDGRTAVVECQLPDGSWACQPCLRVTDPRCHQSVPGAPGRVHRDRRGVFSTVHAVAALAHVGRALALPGAVDDAAS